MPHGGPDWGTAGEVKTIYTIEDLGELAARLGSVVTFDRRGNVILIDDFESGIDGWSCSATGPGYAITWDSQNPCFGAFSAKVVSPDGDGNYVIAQRSFSFPVLGKMGVEVCYSYLHNAKYFLITPGIYTGNVFHSPTVRWNQATLKWQIRDETNTWHDVSGAFDIAISAKKPYVAKLVVDYLNRKYVRLIINNQELDISSFSYLVTSDTTAPYGWLLLQLWTRTGIATAYLHYLILTQNEP